MQESSLIVDVADQGPGIPKEHLIQVFNKFFRLSRAEEVSGTGLGWPSVKESLKPMGEKSGLKTAPEEDRKLFSPSRSMLPAWKVNCKPGIKDHDCGKYG